MSSRLVRPGLVLATALALGACRAGAQASGPAGDASEAARPGRSTSLGPLPGSGGSRGGASYDPGEILGGRIGPSFPRVPAEITTPGRGFALRPGPGITVPPAPSI